jgi:hypothetical protein
MLLEDKNTGERWQAKAVGPGRISGADDCREEPRRLSPAETRGAREEGSRKGIVSPTGPANYRGHLAPRSRSVVP